MMIITVDFEDRVVIVLVDWLAWGFILVFTESLKNVLDQVPDTLRFFSSPCVLRRITHPLYT